VPRLALPTRRARRIDRPAVIFNEEYVRAGAPGGSASSARGSSGRRSSSTARPSSSSGSCRRSSRRELWCQGYSEPDAGSDLANVSTRALRDGDEWVLSGRRCGRRSPTSRLVLVVCRTEEGSTRHVASPTSSSDGPARHRSPSHHPVDTNSRVQRVFFDGARTGASNVVGDVGGGWQVALATLAFERGVGMLGHSCPSVVSSTVSATGTRPRRRRRSGPAPTARSGLHRAVGHAVQHPAQPLGVRRSRSPSEASIASCSGELAQRLGDSPWTRPRGGDGARGPTTSSRRQRTFLFSRAETIYGGSNQIQRNIIGERVLGLPPDPKVEAFRSSSRVKVAAVTLGDGFTPPPCPPPGGTRAARGQGGDVTAAPARASARHGASLCRKRGSGRRLGRARATTRRDGRRAHCAFGRRRVRCACDVTNESEVRHLFDATIERHGRLDVAVHNAGWRDGRAGDMTDEQWMRVLT